MRDVLAWLRLLLDPQDAAAVVRALARPPVELRQVHLARVIQLARRRKLDLVSGLALAGESPNLPPEARERIERFVEMHGRAAAGLDTLGPEAFIASLIDILATRGRTLLQTAGAIERQASLEQLRALAGTFTRRQPSLTPRELAAQLAGLAPQIGRRTRTSAASTSYAPAAGAAKRPEPLEAHPRGQVPAGDGDERLELTLAPLKEELLESVLRIGGRLGAAHEILHVGEGCHRVFGFDAFEQRAKPSTFHGRNIQRRCIIAQSASLQSLGDLHIQQINFVHHQQPRLLFHFQFFQNQLHLCVLLGREPAARIRDLKD